MNEDKSARFRRLQRRASILSAASAAIFLAVVLISGAAAAFRDALGGSSLTSAVSFTVVLVVLSEVLQTPFAYYKGVALERRYGLSRQGTVPWLVDHVRAANIGLAVAVVAVTIVWTSIRLVPGMWWLPASVAAAAGLAIVAYLTPVVLLPLFDDVVPLDRPALAGRIQALAARAGVPVLGVYMWCVGGRTRKATAALAGLGRTRRVLISDTLLDEHSDEEIEVVLAHELAHHVHGDLWSALAVEAAIVAAALFAAQHVLVRTNGAFGITGPADVAALPLLALTGAAAVVLLRPLANALSRAHERRADRFALEMTNDAPSFISAMKRLGAQNLAEERPTRLVEVLFYTHPPMASRIQAAMRFGSPAPPAA